MNGSFPRKYNNYLSEEANGNPKMGSMAYSIHPSSPAINQNNFDPKNIRHRQDIDWLLT
jgi:hypothetical protein